MPFFTKIFSQILEEERREFPLWIPVLFGAGIVFYFKFSAVFYSLFAVAVFLFIISRSFILLACIAFLLGGFYAKFYEKPAEISAKTFVEVTGKVESIHKFYNPINHLEGANLVVSDPTLKKPIAYQKKHQSKKSKLQKAEKKEQKISKRKPKKKRKISIKKIEKDFVNLDGYQEIDRKFLDQINAYQNEIPQNLKRISVNLVKGANDISINDKIAFNALLQPPQKREFPDSFDYQLDAKIKKIAAYGFIAGEVKILEKGKISNFDEWFLSLREKIRQNIYAALKGDEAAIAAAFLIGDQKEISKDLSTKIRNSGLAHLLSISGFHLSLAGAIFFFSIRFLLSRNENLTLKFDLKKIAAFLAIFAVYFYLKIADSPLPAQRAFILVLFGLLSLLFDRKLDAKRATMFAVLLMILANPYVIFSVSFQLSFAAILVLISFSKPKQNYFWQIILLSIFIQIATLPFLVHHFRNVSLLGFIGNLLAIPLASFFILPLGFLALIFMPLNLASPFLWLMNLGVLALEKIANFITSLPYSHFSSPWLPGSGLALASFGLLIICLGKSKIRLIGALIFLLSFLTIFSIKNPDLIFEKNQKFFAVYDGENLFFSKKLRASKQRQLWMDEFDQKEFKIIFCEKNFCEVEVKNHKILALLKRNKIDEICKKDFDVIVNLTKKYKLPHCIKENIIRIDNENFLTKETQFLFFENEKFGAQKIDQSGETKRDDEGEFRDDAEDIDADF